MRSATSYFNFTLFRKNLARFWPIWGLYSLIWLVLLPVNMLTYGKQMNQFAARMLPLEYLDGMSGIVLMLSPIFGILAAMAVFSYLYSSRSAAFLHTLPVRREGLFLTNYLSGLAFLIIPNVAVFLLALIVETALGILVFSSLFTWLAVTSMLDLFFYSFAVFCAMFTGHILALPAFYGILNGLAAGIFTLIRSMADTALFGFAGADWIEQASIWLTPVLLAGSNTGIIYGPDGSGDPCFTGLGYVFLLALLGIVLAVLALLVYRRRQLERAGDVVSVGWVRPIFQYGVAFCCAITLGNLFHSIFYELLSRSTWVLLGWMLLWGAFGCFVAAMLLRKTFWVFKSCWKGCAVFLAVLTAAMGLLELDGFGFESRVPDPSQVKSVTVDQIESYPSDDLRWATFEVSDPALIEDVTALHQRIVEEKDWLEDTASYYYSNNWMAAEGGVSVQTEGCTDLRLTYILTDGTVMERLYYLPVTADTLSDPTSPDAMLQALINTPGLAQDGYLAHVDEEDRLVDAVLTAISTEDGMIEDYVPAEALPELEAAIRADLAAGNLGRRYLLEDWERLENCCYCDLQLTYRMGNTGQSSHIPNTQPATTEAETWPDTYTITITLQKSAANTLSVLEQYGFDPDAMLPSQAEYQMAHN